MGFLAFIWIGQQSILDRKWGGVRRWGEGWETTAGRNWTCVPAGIVARKWGGAYWLAPQCPPRVAYLSRYFTSLMASSWIAPKKKNAGDHNIDVPQGQRSKTIIVQPNWRLFILSHGWGHFLWRDAPRNVMTSAAGSGNVGMCHPQNQCSTICFYCLCKTSERLLGYKLI